MPSKSVPTTPYELWIGAKPNLENLRPWGCADFVHSTSHKYGKLGPRASKKIFIRYSESSKRYVMYGEHSDGGMTEIESRDVNIMSCKNLKVSYHLWVRVENHNFILKLLKIVGVIWLLVGANR